MRNLYWSCCSLDGFDDVLRISLPKASRAHAVGWQRVMLPGEEKLCLD
jgi:hypothetical protein